MDELSFRANRKLEALRCLADDSHAKTLPSISQRQRIENDMSVVAREMYNAPADRYTEYCQVFDGLQNELAALNADAERRASGRVPIWHCSRA